MSRYLIKLKDKFCEWSTIVDAPVSYMMDETELKKYIKRKEGEEGLKALPQRLARVAEQGTSCEYRFTVAQCIRGNRAGPAEMELSEDEIVKWYTKPKRNRRKTT